MAINNDYTSIDYNSYFLDLATLDSAVEALDGFWDLTSWRNLTDQQKENIMFGANEDLNSFCFVGRINQSIISQYNMQFPRSDLVYQNGVSIASNEIPLFVLNYIAERSLEKNANVQTGEFYDGRIKRNKLGKLEQEFQNPRDSRLLQNTLRNASSFSNISAYVIGLTGGFRYVTRT